MGQKVSKLLASCSSPAASGNTGTHPRWIVPQAAAYVPKGGLGCAKAHTAQTSPLSQVLYLRIFLPSLQVTAAKRTNSSWRVKARKEEQAPGPDGFNLPPAWAPLLCHTKAESPPDRGYHVSLQPQALPLTAGCA